VNVWNLCDLIERLLRDSIPVESVFMVSDGEDLSTPELIRRIGRAMDRPARLIPVPLAVLRYATALTGRRAEFERLCGSLAVDMRATRAELGWHPPVSLDEGLSRTAVGSCRRSKRRDACACHSRRVASDGICCLGIHRVGAPPRSADRHAGYSKLAQFPSRSDGARGGLAIVLTFVLCLLVLLFLRLLDLTTFAALVPAGERSRSSVISMTAMRCVREFASECTWLPRFAWLEC